jgi:hypothetical protein
VVATDPHISGETLSEPASDEATETDESTEPEPDLRAIEEAREKRLDPDNRPDNAEIDNTDRDFDVVKGHFTDTEDDPDIGSFNDPNSADGEAEA